MLSSPASGHFENSAKRHRHFQDKLSHCNHSYPITSAQSLLARENDVKCLFSGNGVSLADLADLMGHKDLATTRIYAKVEQRHLRSIASKLSILVPGDVSPKAISRKFQKITCYQSVA